MPRPLNCSGTPDFFDQLIPLMFSWSKQIGMLCRRIGEYDTPYAKLDCLIFVRHAINSAVSQHYSKQKNLIAQVSFFHTNNSQPSNVCKYIFIFSYSFLSFYRKIVMVNRFSKPRNL